MPGWFSTFGRTSFSMNLTESLSCDGSAVIRLCRTCNMGQASPPRWAIQFARSGRTQRTIRLFSLDNVAALLGQTPAGLLPDVEAALGADLLVATPESLTFDRELVWRALAESVPGRPVKRCTGISQQHAEDPR